MAEPIEMPFGLRTQVGPENHVLDVGPYPPMGRGNFEGGKGRPLRPVVKHRDTLQSSVQKQLNRQSCRLVCGLGWVQRNVLYGVQIPCGKGQFQGGEAPIVKYRDTLWSPV